MTGRSPPITWLMLPLAVVLVCSAAAAIADGGVDAGIDPRELGEGFRAIDMLQDLKAAYDQRMTDCRATGEKEAYCGCVNSRATLDLTYADFVEVARNGDADRAVRQFGIPRSRAAEAIEAGTACRAAR